MGKTLAEFQSAHDAETVIARLRADLKDAQRQSADAAAIKDYIGTLKLELEKREPPKWVAQLAKGAKPPGTPTLFLSDLHWGEVVVPSQIGGVNTYNMSIARRRLTDTVESAIHLLRILDPQMRYPGIVLPLGGDMISGNIHDELQATNELNTMPTVLDLFGQLKLVIRRAAEVFGKVYLPCVSGNHGRDTKKIWAKDRNHTSFDWLLYQLLADHFQTDERIEFFIPDGSDALYSVFNTRYNLTHGDQFRGGDGIIGPLGPIMRGDQKKRTRNQQVNQAYDILMCGHFHTYMSLSWLIVNGSLKGYDEYAAAGNFKFEPPKQALWMTHPDYGVTYSMPVYCDGTKRPKGAKWAGR